MDTTTDQKHAGATEGVQDGGGVQGGSSILSFLAATEVKKMEYDNIMQ
jgi:hypothetical protein